MATKLQILYQNISQTYFALFVVLMYHTEMVIFIKLVKMLIFTELNKILATDRRKILKHGIRESTPETDKTTLFFLSPSAANNA